MEYSSFMDNWGNIYCRPYSPIHLKRYIDEQISTTKSWHINLEPDIVKICIGEDLYEKVFGIHKQRPKSNKDAESVQELHQAVTNPENPAEISELTLAAKRVSDNFLFIVGLSIWVFNIPSVYDNVALAEMFIAAGYNITSARITGYRKNKTGLGFVTFDHHKSAIQAVNQFDFLKIHGYRLIVFAAV